MPETIGAFALLFPFQGNWLEFTAFPIAPDTIGKAKRLPMR
jgi:hypothetical protein